MPPNGIVFSQSDTIRQQAVGEDTDALTFGVVPWGHNHEIHRSSSSHHRARREVLGEINYIGGRKYRKYLLP